MDDQARLVVDQLAYLIDEVTALQTVIRGVPEALMEATPVEGEPSVKELLESIAAQDRDVRIPVVRALLSEPKHEELARVANAGVEELLAAMREGRSELLRVVGEVGDVSAARVAVDGEEIALVDFLYRVVQEDADVLRRAAERLHEAMPLGSPGFSRRG